MGCGCNDEILWFIILFLLLFCGCGSNRGGCGCKPCDPCGC